MYPCEDCGYQGQYIISLQNQIHEAHSITSEVENSNNLDDHDMSDFQCILTESSKLSLD